MRLTRFISIPENVTMMSNKQIIRLHGCHSEQGSSAHYILKNMKQANRQLMVYLTFKYFMKNMWKSIKNEKKKLGRLQRREINVNAWNKNLSTLLHHRSIYVACHHYV